MDNQLQDFFANDDEDAKKRLQQSADQAPSEDQGKPKPIDHPGRYMCEVATFAYRNKEKTEVKSFPSLFLASTTKSLNLSVNLQTVESTAKVPKGASIYTNIALCPKEKTQENIDKTMRFAKPRLVALTGTEKISLTPEWIDEWLLPKFDSTGTNIKLVRDHKMKQRVMVIVDEVLGNDGKIRLSVKSISKVVAGDKSESFDFKTDAPVAEPSPIGHTDDAGVDFGGAVDAGADGSSVAHMEEF